MDSEEPKTLSVEAHEASDVSDIRRALETAAPQARDAMSLTASFHVCSDDAPVPDGAVKKLFLIRHGEGHHNVAQREWRAQPSWDGASEPYTLDTDPDFRYVDAMLTDKGEAQATALQSRAAAISPELMVLSPMRRATQTGLLAFQQKSGAFPVVALELAHERYGKHTCDKRIDKQELQSAYPEVDYSLITSEEDPFWGDGQERESYENLACRACDLLEWLAARPEKQMVLAAHSAILFALLNVPMEAEDEQATGWLATGEMRSILVTTTPK